MFTKDDLVFLTDADRTKPQLLLIGSALNGPVQTVFQLQDDVDPYEVLGKSKLAYGIVRARDNGVNPLVFRLNGSHGEATLLHEESGIPCLSFKTVEATNECNNIHLHCYSTHMVARGLQQERVFLFSDYQTIAELADAVNLLMWYEGFELEATALAPDLNPQTMIQLEKIIYMEGAYDGFHYIPQTTEEGIIYEIDGVIPRTNTQNALFLLQNTLLLEDRINTDLDLLGYTLDTICYSDIPYESAPEDLLRTFGLFSYEYTEQYGTYVASVLSSITPHETYHPKDNPFNLDPEWLKHLLIAEGEEVSTVFQEDTMPISLNYAALRYKTEGTTSNIPFPENTILVNEHGKVKIAELVGKGYICTTGTKKNVIVPFYEQNLYPSSSYLSKSYLLRSAYQDIAQIAELFNDSIGEIFSANKLLIVQQLLNELCEEIKKKPHYREVSSSLTQVDDMLMVSIQIVFYGEIGSMTVMASYNKS